MACLRIGVATDQKILLFRRSKGWKKCVWSENSMRLFVTGATGVIGRRAVPLLRSQGHSVTAGVRQAARRVGIAQKDLNYVTVDLFDLGGLRRAVTGHDAIINSDADATISLEDDVS
jgi:nucleoside-diphosphate-sugar epimerase